MQELGRRGLLEPIRTFCATGRPFLGICVGMQVLMQRSTELGEHAGIGLLQGSVERIPSKVDGTPLKVPHIGWSRLLLPDGAPGDRWVDTVFAQFAASRHSFYFVHSYEARPMHRTDILAEVDYGGHRIVAAVQRGNMAGVQFHPERSGVAGQRMLRHFIAM
jgi:glutamine amidotransferase